MSGRLEEGLVYRVYTVWEFQLVSPFQLLPVAGSQFLAAPSSHLPASSQIIIHLATDSNHLLENTNTSATNDALRR